MANVIGPTWGSEAAGIIMEGGRWKQQRELQEDSQAHDEKMRNMESILKARSEYASKVMGMVEELHRNNEGGTPEAQALTQEAIRIMEQNLGVDPGTINPEIFSAALPGLISEAEKQAEVQTRVSEATEEDVITQITQRTRAGEQALEAGDYKNILLGKESEAWEERFGMEREKHEVGVEATEAQIEATRAATETENLLRDSKKEAIDARNELMEIQGKKIRGETVNPGLTAMAIQARVRYLDAMGTQMQARAAQYKSTATAQHLEQRMDAINSIVDAAAKTGDPNIQKEAYGMILIEAEKMGFDLALQARQVPKPSWYDSIMPLRMFMREVMGKEMATKIDTFLTAPGLQAAVEADIQKNKALGIPSLLEAGTDIAQNLFLAPDPSSTESFESMYYMTEEE